MEDSGTKGFPEVVRDRHHISGSFGTSHEALQIADCRLQIAGDVSPAVTKVHSLQPTARSLRRAIKVSVDSRLAIVDWPRLKLRLRGGAEPRRSFRPQTRTVTNPAAARLTE